MVVAGYAPSLVNFRGPLLTALRSAGHRTIAAAPHLRGSAAARQLEAQGIECRDIPLSRTGTNPFFDLRLAVALARLMRREKVGTVLSYTVKPVIFGTIAAALAGVPRRFALITGLGYAFTGNATGVRAAVRWVTMRLYRSALKRATHIFFQNPDDSSLFRKLGLLPSDVPVSIVNGSGVDLTRFKPAPFQAKPLRFLLIARLLTAKGIREYAAAAALLRKTYAAAEFHLVGGLDSNPDALAEDEVQEWHRSGTLRWHGEAADVRPHIADCHVYVLPSYREGTPRTVLEAMAMGRPIITSDAPGCRETVVDGVNGYLVPPRSVEPLAQAMQRFLDEPNLVETMGRRSYDLAVDKYDVVKVNAQMMREMELS